ncbi:hypothetical protein GCM10022291_14570 [Postechiella marina]|uniref:Thioredoxin domain-containing protein n=1 Tax=Postechiella marina TaxID=943941 RepID=A0ABP8C6Q0_9FLAO
MKNIILITSLILSLVGCKENSPKTTDYVIISGTITNSSSKTIELKNSIMFDVDPNPKHTINLSENGSFRDTLNVMDGHFYFIEGKNITSLYLYKGVDINISYNATNFESSIKLTGEGAPVSKYLLKKERIIKKAYGRTGEDAQNSKNIFDNIEADFITKIDDIKTEMEIALSETQNIPEEIRAKEQKDIHYQYIDFISRYKSVYPYISKDSTYIPSKSFTKALDELTYDRVEDFMQSSLYQYALFNHFKDIAVKNTEESYPTDMEFLNVFNTVPNEVIKNKMLYFETNTRLPRKDDLTEIYNFFMNNSTDTFDKERITNLYNELKVLSKGAPSPTFENYENHAGDTNSLSDFKGKYVYIDIWATWCGPCKYEIPFLEKIEKEYNDKNIAFISISVDTKKAYSAWKNMVTNDNMKGIQLLADKAFKSKFVKDYKVNGIPKFILIDPAGNIVSSNAPRPSSDNIKPFLNKLLN